MTMVVDRSATFFWGIQDLGFHQKKWLTCLPPLSTKSQHTLGTRAEIEKSYPPGVVIRIAAHLGDWRPRGTQTGGRLGVETAWCAAIQKPQGRCQSGHPRRRILGMGHFLALRMFSKGSVLVCSGDPWGSSGDHPVWPGFMNGTFRFYVWVSLLWRPGAIHKPCINHS